MTDLPTKTDLTSGTTTEADFQSAIGALYDYVSEIAVKGEKESVTISSGSITPSSGFLEVDTEATASTDDLTNIVPTNLGSQFIFLTNTSGARSVVLKHQSGGSGQLSLRDSADVTLRYTNQMICFSYNSSNSTWVEIFRNFGVYVPHSTDQVSARAMLGLTSAAITSLGTGSGQIPTVNDLGALAFLASVGSSQITDGAVSTNKLADDALTLAKIAHRTGENTILGYKNGVPSVYNLTEIGGGINRVVFTGSGTFTIPTGVTKVKVTVIAGGGGGVARDRNAAGTGGQSSFGGYLTANGGGAPTGTPSGTDGNETGLKSGTDGIGSIASDARVLSAFIRDGKPFGAIGPYVATSIYDTTPGAFGFGRGGQSHPYYPNIFGGNGGAVEGIIDVSGLSNVSITVGTAGGGSAPNANYSGYNGKNGAPGGVIIDY